MVEQLNLSAHFEKESQAVLPSAAMWFISGPGKVGNCLICVRPHVFALYHNICPSYVYSWRAVQSCNHTFNFTTWTKTFFTCYMHTGLWSWCWIVYARMDQIQHPTLSWEYHRCIKLKCTWICVEPPLDKGKFFWCFDACQMRAFCFAKYLENQREKDIISKP